MKISTRLLVQELGDAKRLDALCATPVEQKQNRMAIVNAPEFLVHIAAGNLPNPTLMSMRLRLLTRSAQFVKCASGSSFLPRLFAHSIYDADPKLGACLEIAEWRGGNAALENALFAEADCVTATGSDETLAAIRSQLPSKIRFLGYGHRVSFGYIAGEDLFGSSAKKIVARAADDVVAWNQLGCLSPHVIYVERRRGCAGTICRIAGGGIGAAREDRAARRTARWRLRRPSRRAGRIYEVRAAHSPETTRHWRSKDSTAWTVVYEADAAFSNVVPEPFHLRQSRGGSDGNFRRR